MPLPPVDDDRDKIGPGDHVVLIAEDDVKFAQVLVDTAHAKGFKAVTALEGDTALTLARQLEPDAITLDINLPVLDGWTVLDRIKLDPATRHIPVHIITVEGERERGLQRGALAYLEKPVTIEALEAAFARIAEYLARPRKLLLVDDDPEERQRIVDLIGNGDVLTTAVASGEEALDTLRAEHFDCMVLDLGLPGISGFEVMETIQQDPALQDLPIIIYTGKKLTRKEETQLRKMAETIIVKGVQSPERLLDETALFLHRVASRLPERKRDLLEQLYRSDAQLAGKKLLIVDDDVRNVFALTALLERHGITVVTAETGKDGIAALNESPDVDLVLMDVMMPEMDGYDTMRAVRKIARFKSLPIIALTAKAMKGDREKCIQAGASDYIAKPIDGEQLLSLLRVWLYH